MSITTSTFEYLIWKLGIMGFEKQDLVDNEDPTYQRFAKWVNITFENNHPINLYIVVDLKDNRTFTNTWMDKMRETDLNASWSMGNGFIHKSAYTNKTADKILEILKMAG